MTKYFRIYKSKISTLLKIPNFYSRSSFSQEGEDLILLKMFNHKKDGFYVDVGAHHPYRYSNTFLLYKSGWCGINIEPNPNSKLMFDRTRSRDINIEAGVSSKKGWLEYFIFHDTALNTFSRITSSIIQKTGQGKLINTKSIMNYPLSYILGKYMKTGKPIDLLNIDCEGNEMDVLISNNWNKYRPKVISIEIISGYSLKYIINCDIYKYLIKSNYTLASFTCNTAFFIDKQPTTLLFDFAHHPS